MSLVSIIGAVLGVIASLAGIYRLYITITSRRSARKEVEKANATADKYKREAENHAAPGRSKSAIIGRLRDRIGK